MGKVYAEIYTHLPTKPGNEEGKTGGQMTRNAFILCLRLLIHTLLACSNFSEYVALSFEHPHRREGEDLYDKKK